MVFTKNEKALRSLLSSILNIPEKEIIKIVILNPMQYTEAIDTKTTILDLRLHLNGEKYILVEMQVRNYPSWTNRTLVYACRQVADQAKGGEFKYSKIQPVIQIAIMNYSLFPDHKKFFAKYNLRDEDGYIYSDKIEFIVVDLTEIDRANEQEKEQGLAAWAEAFKADDWRKVSKIENNGVKEAMKTMTMIMANPTERDLLWERRIAEIDRRSLLEDLKEESMAEGRAKGMAEGRAEGMAEGMAQGMAQGRTQGENRMSELMNTLFELNRWDDARKSVVDPDFREIMYQEFHL